MTLTIDSSCQIEVQSFKKFPIFMLSRGSCGLQEGITNCSTVELKTSQYTMLIIFSQRPVCLLVSRQNIAGTTPTRCSRSVRSGLSNWYRARWVPCLIRWLWGARIAVKFTCQETMEADWAKWVARNKALKNADEEIDFQTDYVLDIAKLDKILLYVWLKEKSVLDKSLESTQGLRIWLPLGFGCRRHVQGWNSFEHFPLSHHRWHHSHCWHHYHHWHHYHLAQEWHHHKDEDILTYRDKSFASKFTGKLKVISCINLFKNDLMLPFYRLVNATNFNEIIYFVLISIDF